MDGMHLILESVKIDLDEDEIRRLIDAVEHYEAYPHSQQRGRGEVPGVAGAAQEDAREAIVSGIRRWNESAVLLSVAVIRLYSALSFALAASFVCHCMLLGSSAPPRFNGVT
jgi:hypothetical protein